METEQAFSAGKLRVSQEAKQFNFLLLAICNVVLILVVLVAGSMSGKKSHYLVHSDGTPERAVVTTISSTAKAESSLHKTDSGP